MPARAALTQAVLDRVAVGLIGFDPGLHVVLCNHSAAGMLGMAAPELWRPMPFGQLLARGTKLNGAGRLAFEAVLRTTPTLTHDDASDLGDRLVKVSLSDGRVLHVALSNTAEGFQLATLIIETAGVPNERVDGLTGLSDRQWFRERVADMLAAPGLADQVAVLMIDLDRFKTVNDSHGHPVGDALLQTVARRLRSAVRDGDVVSRLGGDEFAVAMPAGAAAEAMGKRLVDLLSRPYLIDGHVAIIGASIGIALGPQDGADMAALVRAADLALYQAKEDGRQTVRMFEQGMDARARARHLLLDDLRRALALHQFEIHYQPQLNLTSRKLVGFEALVLASSRARPGAAGPVHPVSGGDGPHRRNR